MKRIPGKKAVSQIRLEEFPTCVLPNLKLLQMLSCLYRKLFYVITVIELRKCIYCKFSSYDINSPLIKFQIAVYVI